jgi:ubiquinone/menaquinone biosynthesis C-methylase UbiE
MSDQQRRIYQSEGERYEALISREDYRGNIPGAIDEIVNVDGLDILDLGAGTGRLTLLLAPRARSIRAFDASAGMLRVCRERLIASGLSNWQVDVADHRQLPVQDHSADLVVSGWSVSYLAVWDQEHGAVELDKRTRPAGTCRVDLSMAGCQWLRQQVDPHGLPVRLFGRGARIIALFLRR